VYLQAGLEGTENLAPTVQPLTSRCTERAISAISSSLNTKINYLLNNFIWLWERVEFEGGT
jgi:hypothetical protein